MTVKNEITKKKKPKQKQKQKQKQTVVVNVHVGDKAGKGKEKENRMIAPSPIYVSSDNRMQAPNYKQQIPQMFENSQGRYTLGVDKPNSNIPSLAQQQTSSQPPIVFKTPTASKSLITPNEPVDKYKITQPVFIDNPLKTPSNFLSELTSGISKYQQRTQDLGEKTEEQAKNQTFTEFFNQTPKKNLSDALNDLSTAYVQEPDKISNYEEPSSNEEPPALETIPPIFQKTQIKSPSLSSNMFSALIEEEEEQTQPSLASAMEPVPIVEPIEEANVVTPAKRGKKPHQTSEEKQNKKVEKQMEKLGLEPTDDPQMNIDNLARYKAEQKKTYDQNIRKIYKKRVSKK
jgi:hypothetical protein